MRIKTIEFTETFLVSVNRLASNDTSKNYAYTAWSHVMVWGTVLYVCLFR